MLQFSCAHILIQIGQCWSLLNFTSSLHLAYLSSPLFLSLSAKINRRSIHLLGFPLAPSCSYLRRSELRRHRLRSSPPRCPPPHCHCLRSSSFPVPTSAFSLQCHIAALQKSIAVNRSYENKGHKLTSPLAICVADVRR